MNKNFKYNPFSGVLDEDIEETLVPRFDVAEMIKIVKQSDSLAIEFIGKQGRGKTSHLVFLQNQLEEYPMFLLNKNASIDKILNHESDVVFVDSIHHLSFLNRVKIFKMKRIVIYTTHWTRVLDCFLIRRKMYKIRFRGINAEILLELINRRFQIASFSGLEKSEMSYDEAEQLINQFGDNYRGIINHLYEIYQ